MNDNDYIIQTQRVHYFVYKVHCIAVLSLDVLPTTTHSRFGFAAHLIFIDMNIIGFISAGNESVIKIETRKDIMNCRKMKLKHYLLR